MQNQHDKPMNASVFGQILPHPNRSIIQIKGRLTTGGVNLAPST